MDIKHGILIAIIIYLLMQRNKKGKPMEEILPPAPPVKDVKQLNVCSSFVDQYGTGRCSSVSGFNWYLLHFHFYPAFKIGLSYQLTP